MWMKIWGTLAFIVMIILSIIVDMFTWLLLIPFIASTIYMIRGIWKAKSRGYHILNEAPNALRLLSSSIGGLLIGETIISFFSLNQLFNFTILLTLGLLLYTLGLIVNDEKMRLWFRKIFPKTGFSIAMLGIDGSGKSTYSRLLYEIYSNLNIKAHVISYSKYIFVEKLSSLLRHSRSSSGRSRIINFRHHYYYSGGRLRRLLRLILSLIDNILLFLIYVKPKTLRGEIVILDRFMWSTYIKYWALGYPVKKLRRLWFLFKPHYAIIFDVPSNVSFNRIIERGEHIRYPKWILEKERRMYLKIAENYGYPIVDTTGDIKITRKHVTRLAQLIYLNHIKAWR